MRSSGKRIFSILVSILMLIGALFIYATFMKPAYSQIKNLRTEVSSRLDFINKHENYIQEVKKVLNEYQNITEITQTTSLILPINRDIALGLNQINGIAFLNNLSIELLGVQEMAISPSSQLSFIKGVGNLRFNLRLVGSYENFKSFIQAIETNITLIDLVSLKIDPILGGGAAKNFNYTIILNTYYQTEN
ncbi:type 4a pilus biogenesis protein PilO [Candidatus Wolfebacteria bacterium]|nr:type 4a pilus biogenesis protein PilO [Candidatus Wolfebacteria bacterium]